MCLHMCASIHMCLTVHISYKYVWMSTLVSRCLLGYVYPVYASACIPSANASSRISYIYIYMYNCYSPSIYACAYRCTCTFLAFNVFAFMTEFCDSSKRIYIYMYVSWYASLYTCLRTLVPVRVCLCLSLLFYVHVSLFSVCIPVYIRLLILKSCYPLHVHLCI